MDPCSSPSREIEFGLRSDAMMVFTKVAVKAATGGFPWAYSGHFFSQNTTCAAECRASEYHESSAHLIMHYTCVPTRHVMELCSHTCVCAHCMSSWDSVPKFEPSRLERNGARPVASLLNREHLHSSLDASFLRNGNPLRPSLLS